MESRHPGKRSKAADIASLQDQSQSSASAPPESLFERSLKFFEDRAQCDLLEGIRFQDANTEANDIIFVSDSEYYSVPNEYIIDVEGAEDGRPHRIWIKKGVPIWRGQKTILDGSHQGVPLKPQDLHALIDRRIANSTLISSAFDSSTAVVQIKCTGSVKFGANRNPPNRDEVKHRIVRRSDFPTYPKIDDSTLIQPTLMHPNDQDPSVLLAGSCMNNDSRFHRDELNIIDNEIRSADTLGEFADYILACYTRTHQ